MARRRRSHRRNAAQYGALPVAALAVPAVLAVVGAGVYFWKKSQDAATLKKVADLQQEKSVPVAAPFDPSTDPAVVAAMKAAADAAAALTAANTAVANAANSAAGMVAPPPLKTIAGTTLVDQATVLRTAPAEQYTVQLRNQLRSRLMLGGLGLGNFTG